MSDQPETAPLFPWRATFVDRDIEESYRDSTQADDAQFLSTALMLFGLTVIAFAWADYAMLGLGWKFYSLILSRTITLACLVTCMFTARKVSNTLKRDRVLTGALIVVFINTTYVSTTRPPDYLDYIPVHIVAILALFVVIRVPFMYQMIIATVPVTLDISLLFLLKEVGTSVGVFAILMTYIIAVTIGSTASWQLHVRTRERFAALLTVKTLKDFIPICANCEKVRDDDGFWKGVSAYLAEQTDTTVTHGICPECAEELYPGYVNKERKKDKAAS